MEGQSVFGDAPILDRKPLREDHSCMTHLATLFLLLFLIFITGCSNTSEPELRYRIYVGTYTEAESEGIYVADFSTVGPELSELRLAAPLKQTTYQSIDRDSARLFSTGTLAGVGENNGVLKSFAIQDDGALKEISARPAEKSPILAYVNYRERYGSVFTISYAGGGVHAYPVDAMGVIGEESGYAKHVGGSGVVESRQLEAHPHSIYVHPIEPYVYVPDLGQDAVVHYSFDSGTGELEMVSRLKSAGGSGPRHMAFHSSGRFAYVNNEISSTVDLLSIDADNGSMEIVDTISTLPEEFKGPNSTAQILLSPDERHLYVSNRGHNSIAIFAVGEEGKLTSKDYVPSKGRSPRNFSIDPTGKWMAIINRGGDNLVIYKVDPETGALKDAKLETYVSTPACVNWVAVD